MMQQSWGAGGLRDGHGYRVTPVVGRVEPPIDLKSDPIEVADVFKAPLALLLDRETTGAIFRMVGETRLSFDPSHTETLYLGRDCRDDLDAGSHTSRNRPGEGLTREPEELALLMRTHGQGIRGNVAETVDREGRKIGVQRLGYEQIMRFHTESHLSQLYGMLPERMTACKCNKQPPAGDRPK
jgi:hypothetical protein